MGLLFMQIVYIDKMVNMRNDHFKELVTLSLYNVASNLDRDETKYFLDKHLDNSQSRMINYKSGQFNPGEMDFNRNPSLENSFNPDNNPRFSSDRNNLSPNFGYDKSRQEILKSEYLKIS